MNRTKGFGLLEILITLVVLGVGVAGLVSVGKIVLQTSQGTRDYETAIRLAQSRLDKLRQFNDSAGYLLIVSGSASTVIVSQAVSQAYAETWVVTDQYMGASSAWQTTPPANYALGYPGRKIVNVTVGWTDSSSVSRAVALTGNISPTLSLSSSEMGGGLGKSYPKPQIAQTPGAVPDVVTVAIGASSKETSKPLPDIQGNSSSRAIQLESVTYDTASKTKQSLQDTSTVYCSCKPDVTTQAYLPDSIYYSQTDKVQYWKMGKQVSKATGGLDASKQQDLCSTCCRDHYTDVSTEGFAGYYDPLNPTRARYTYSGSNLVASSGNYVDACRFIRIDGYYRPAPDWRLVSLTVFPASFFTDNTNVAKYQQYITYVATEYTKLQKSAFANNSDSSWSAPGSLSSIASFSAWGGNTAVSTGTGTIQLISRGIFVDTMPPSYLTDQVFKDPANGNVSSIPDVAKIPFQDINMTLLSEWSSSSSAVATVTNAPIQDLDANSSYYGTYSRGRLNAQKTTKSGTTDNPITITAKNYQGNLGVVGLPISPSAAIPIVSSALQVSISSQAQPTATVTGVIKCLDLKTTTTGNGSNKVTVYSMVACSNPVGSLNQTGDMSTMGVNCTFQNPSAPAEASYSCVGAPSTVFTLNLSRSNSQVTPDSQTIILPASGVLTGNCVLIVTDALRSAAASGFLPAGTNIPSSCTSSP